MTLANKVTMLRIALIPPVMVCLAVPSPGWNLLGAAFLGVASLTDYLDGHLSRVRNETSRLGKLLDPMADKLLIAAAFIALVQLGRAPAWIVTLIVGRELVVTGLRAIAAAEGIVVAADRLGKWKMFVQVLAALALALDVRPAGDYLLWAALVLTVVSGAEYLLRHRALFADRQG
ncbi:MAG TPA: CDP-diacylglycerol--glycerol-3-phosphate 3-phosphatidyltransferase [Thermodesulfobacteriota bacterium]|nr:CDP-diacylglycerol--glycerol-3-phosphate 3-phosphatidyltransferase [Thermodesulfobacteriota bacterium]